MRLEGNTVKVRVYSQIKMFSAVIFVMLKNGLQCIILIWEKKITVIVLRYSTKLIL
jgi:hypothetical protein